MSYETETHKNDKAGQTHANLGQGGIGAPGTDPPESVFEVTFASMNYRIRGCERYVSLERARQRVEELDSAGTIFHASHLRVVDVATGRWWQGVKGRSAPYAVYLERIDA